MTPALRPSRGDLPPTATHERRQWRWEPAEPWQGDRDGTLTILLTTVGKRIARTTLHEYAVQIEWEYAVEFGVRSFLLENLRDPDEGGPFRCVVGGVSELCGCEAGRVDRRRADQVGCKHRAALSALCAKGAI